MSFKLALLAKYVPPPLFYRTRGPTAPSLPPSLSWASSWLVGLGKTKASSRRPCCTTASGNQAIFCAARVGAHAQQS